MRQILKYFTTFCHSNVRILKCWMISEISLKVIVSKWNITNCLHSRFTNVFSLNMPFQNHINYTWSISLFKCCYLLQTSYCISCSVDFTNRWLFCIIHPALSKSNISFLGVEYKCRLLITEQNNHHSIISVLLVRIKFFDNMSSLQLACTLSV